MPLGDSGINPGLEASDPARELQAAVRRGESFSGRERHVTLRNEAGRTFTDISGVSGLDLPDDGRAACFTDWDADGDLDLWVSNRGAPGLRYFQNDNPSGGRGLGLRLVGTDCNRDAIGTRAVLYLKGQPPQAREVTAGSGFLAQSSKTLHFGLGTGAEIEKLVVHWPGGAPQTIAVPGPGSFLVRQGAAPEKAPLPTTVDHPRRPGEPPPPDRTFLAQRLPVATVFGRPAGSAGRPMLVALTSESCPDCAAQLADWAAEPPPGVALQIVRVEALAAEDPGRLRLMQLAHDHLFDIAGRPAPTPLSFLIDPGDRLCAIYRGRVDPAALADDISNLSLAGDALRSASIPFPGRWTGGGTPAARPLSFVEDLLDAGLLDAAGRYIERYRAELRGDELFPQLLGRLRALRADR